MQICSVIDCNRVIAAKGLCNKHYLQNSRGGIKTETSWDRNTFTFEDSICKIGLRNTSGTIVDYAIIDIEDYDRVKAYKWTKKTGYAYTFNLGISLQGFILNTKDMLDHKNRIKLDCRKSNLRKATVSQNMANSKLHGSNTSGIRGVSFNKASKNWRAQVMLHGKVVFFKSFKCPLLATLAYDEAALKYFGEFASPNILSKVENL